MVCPDCGKNLINIRIRDDNRESLQVEYCHSCGGYWLDHWEANKISLKNVQDLIKQSPKAIGTKVISEVLKCPHCQIKLEILRGENIPLNCTVLFCPKCHGNWFPQKQLLAFKKAQKTKLAYLKTWQIPIASAFSVLLPILIIFFIGLSIPLTVYLVQRKQEQRTEAQGLIKNFRLYFIDQTTVLFAFNTLEEVSTALEYGINSRSLQKVTVSSKPTTFHQITLRNLFPETIYFYRIILYNKEGKVFSLPTASFQPKEIK